MPILLSFTYLSDNFFPHPNPSPGGRRAFHPSPSGGNYMDEKPKTKYHFDRDRSVARAAYFFLVGGFAFFCTIADRVLVGMANMRRASSSAVNADGSDFCLFMGGSLRRG